MMPVKRVLNDMRFVNKPLDEFDLISSLKMFTLSGRTRMRCLGELLLVEERLLLECRE